MNELLTAMSSDMGINRYRGEHDESFIYRLCYSALGLWCLKIAQNSFAGITGTTKHNQTIVMNDLLQRYAKLFPGIVDKFTHADNPLGNLLVHFRRVYEEAGYLQTDKDNRNRLANFGRNIRIGNTSLFIGVPNKTYNVNGLGVFTSPTAPSSSTREFLIRDELTCEEYFQERFDILDFNDRDITADELQFFNPLSNRVPSQSWSAKLVTDCSIARKSEWGPFYRVIQESDKLLLFADEIVEAQSDSLTSFEYRRLYFAIKAHYNNPLKAWIVKQDQEYSKLRISGHLPNREYYYLLLLSWPFNHAFDKVNFLIRNDFIPEVTDTLKNIGIVIKGGNADA
ncbi:hypothetical protein EHV15_10660 [Paenibacillus oralis]|uniref:Uncharacterized protein n=1 Tax=Paenibacillus oralis TaxID=2490856 RepID=A0A3P3TYZ2_9BACL|nr:hypothetical protein [Paenibacillus oralis]RRJ63327.1 hypothetical protein EHV15_10660 [Paenibacillus oralis]